MKQTCTFRFDQKTIDTLDRLVDTTNSSNKTQVIRKALALMEIVASASVDGKAVSLQINGKETLILL